MARKVVESLICENCVYADPLRESKGTHIFCSKHDVVLAKHTPFCTHFIGDTSRFPIPYPKLNRHIYLEETN